MSDSKQHNKVTLDHPKWPPLRIAIAHPGLLMRRIWIAIAAVRIRMIERLLLGAESEESRRET